MPPSPVVPGCMRLQMFAIAYLQLSHWQLFTVTTAVLNGGSSNAFHTNAVKWCVYMYMYHTRLSKP